MNKLAKIVVTTLAFILFFAVGQTTVAAESGYFQVTHENVTVYDNSTGSLVPIGHLNKGEKFRYVDVDGSWYEIEINGKSGFVYKPATEPTNSNGENNWSSTNYRFTYQGTATADLTVYDNSSGDLIPFAKIKKDHEFNYIEKSGSWIKVEIGDRIGHVYGPAVRQAFTPSDEYFEVLTDYATVYDNSTGELIPIGGLWEGNTFKFIDKVGRWLKINYYGQIGYVYAPATQPSYRGAETNWISYNKSHNNVAYALMNLSIYDNSSGSLEHMGKVDRGQKFRYIRQVGDWMEIQIGQRVGYVYAPAVKREYRATDQYFEPLQNNVSVYIHNSNGDRVPVGQLAKGQTYKIVEQIGNWIRIQYKDHSAYVYKPATRPMDHMSGYVSDISFSDETIIFELDTPVYTNTSRNSANIAVLKKGVEYPIVEMVSGQWAKIAIGNRYGYVSQSDYTVDISYKNYDLNFDRMVDIQMEQGSPKYDGAGRIPADRDNVEYYLNPANFEEGSSGFLQFLILDKQTNVSAAYLNNEILVGKGTLEGEGLAFIEAGAKYQLNELYLVAHALHETGNGQSTLAQGVPIDVDSSGNVTILDSKNDSRTDHVVYNMFGYGAADSNPLRGGVLYAYQNEWFSPAAAIVGGAKDIDNSYIDQGQNTLYKMKWDPEYAEANNSRGKQYATHVMWPTLQADKIFDMIGDHINEVAMFFEVPRYDNQPPADGSVPPPPPEPSPDQGGDGEVVDYPGNVTGLNTVDPEYNLNLRAEPSTNASIIASIPSGTKFDVLAKNSNDWYQVVYNGKTGWVSGEYVKILNLYQVTDALNYRDNPAGTKVGTLRGNPLIAVQVDDEGNPISVNKALGGTMYTWYGIYIDGNVYWVANDYLTKVQ